MNYFNPTIDENNMILNFNPETGELKKGPKKNETPFRQTRKGNSYKINFNDIVSEYGDLNRGPYMNLKDTNYTRDYYSHKDPNFVKNKNQDPIYTVVYHKPYTAPVHKKSIKFNKQLERDKDYDISTQNRRTYLDKGKTYNSWLHAKGKLSSKQGLLGIDTQMTGLSRSENVYL